MKFEIKDREQVVPTFEKDKHVVKTHTIPAVLELEDGKVEVRAQLEDGRIAVLTLPKGSMAEYEAAVAAYIEEFHQVESPTQEGT